MKIHANGVQIEARLMGGFYLTREDGTGYLLDSKDVEAVRLFLEVHGPYDPECRFYAGRPAVWGLRWFAKCDQCAQERKTVKRAGQMYDRDAAAALVDVCAQVGVEDAADLAWLLGIAVRNGGR